MTRPPPDPEPHFNRRQRRLLSCCRHQRSPWGRSGSIRDHGFHRSYPLRHRSAGYYVRMTASNAEIVRRLQHINNIASSLESLLSGIVNGQLRSIKVPAFLAPSIKQRLLSTTSLLQTYRNESISIDHD